MSTIVDKVFNAAQKILLPIFRGSPNLFTTADLNRQFEAIKFNMDNMEDRVGFSSDLSLGGTYNGTSGILTVTGSLSYIKARGCDFSNDVGSTVNLTLEVQEVNPTIPLYVCLVGTPSLVTYSDDPSHDISGAKFQDGTSMPASDNIVANNVHLTLVDSVPSEGLLGVLALVYITDNGVNIRSNCIDSVGGLASRTLTVDRYSPTQQAGSVSPGITLEEAILRINSMFFTREHSGKGNYPDYITVTAPMTIRVSGTNGFLHFTVGAGNLTIKQPESPTGASTYLARYELPDPFKHCSLVDYFSSLLTFSTMTIIGTDGSGEGRFNRLCVMDTLSEGMFTATKSGTVITGRAKLVLGAKISTTTSKVDSLCVYLVAERYGSMVKASGSSYFSPWAPSESGFHQFYTAYELGDTVVCMSHKDTTIPMLWP